MRCRSENINRSSNVWMRACMHQLCVKEKKHVNYIYMHAGIRKNLSTTDFFFFNCLALKRCERNNVFINVFKKIKLQPKKPQV